MTTRALKTILVEVQTQILNLGKITVAAIQRILTAEVEMKLGLELKVATQLVAKTTTLTLTITLTLTLTDLMMTTIMTRAKSTTIIQKAAIQAPTAIQKVAAIPIVVIQIQTIPTIITTMILQKAAIQALTAIQVVMAMAPGILLHFQLFLNPRSLNQYQCQHLLHLPLKPRHIQIPQSQSQHHQQD